MKQRKQGTAGFTLVELIVVIAILGILAGVGTVAYTGYVKRANKAVDQQLVADIAYALELSAAAGDFDSVEPPARLGETDLGLIPIGYVKLSRDADCQVYGIGTSGDGSYTATEDESGVIAQALRAAFGSGYENTLRLHYDWSGSTASYTGTANMTNATFIDDVDSLWTRVQELSGAVYDKQETIANLLGVEADYFSSDYDVIEKSAAPLSYANQSQDVRDLLAQWWGEETMGLFAADIQTELTAIVSENNSGGAVDGAQILSAVLGCVYARNICMVNYVMEHRVCTEPSCLTNKVASNKREPLGDVELSELTFVSLNDTADGSYDVDQMFCSDCKKYAKTYLSEYAANDALCFLEVMDVVKQTGDSYSGTEALGFDYYTGYINAVKAVYEKLSEAAGDTGSAVVSVFYSGGRLSFGCNPTELGAFQSGTTPASTTSTPESNVVEVTVTENGDGTYTFTPSGTLTLDWNGQLVGYVRLYQNGQETAFSQYGFEAARGQIPFQNGEFSLTKKTSGSGIMVIAGKQNGEEGVGTCTLRYSNSNGNKLEIKVRMKDSRTEGGEGTAATSCYAGLADNGYWYQMGRAAVGQSAEQVTGSLTVSAGSTVYLSQIVTDGSASDGYAVTDIRSWDPNGYTFEMSTGVAVTIEVSSISGSGSGSISFDQNSGVLTVSPTAVADDSYTVTVNYTYKRGTSSTGASKTARLTVTVG